MWSLTNSTFSTFSRGRVQMSFPSPFAETTSVSSSLHMITGCGGTLTCESKDGWRDREKNASGDGPVIPAEFSVASRQSRTHTKYVNDESYAESNTRNERRLHRVIADR